MDKGIMNVPLFSGNLIQKKTLKHRTGFRCFKILTLVIFSILCNIGLATYSQENPGKTNPDETGITMTSFAFGGSGVLFTQVKGQFTAMTGGRGSATFNNRFTFGGAGWGMIKGVEVNSLDADVYQFFRFGYGGLEFGYVLFPGDRMRIGSNMLVVYAAGLAIELATRGELFDLIEERLIRSYQLRNTFPSDTCQPDGLIRG